MYPQQSQNRFRALTGNPVMAIVLALLLAAQTAVAMPHSHPADHDAIAAAEMADLSSHLHHALHAATDEAPGFEQHAESRACCEVECQDCTMGSCSSLTHSRGPGVFHKGRDKRFSALSGLTPEPMISGLYRPPISR